MNTINLLDKGIAIIIMLFILSMISERFVTWVKLHFGKQGKKLWCFSTEDEDLTISSENKALEKIRENKILGLNIIISILIALLANADLFNILREDIPYKAIGWNDISLSETNIWKILIGIFGCILTGFFISLGSKFWHDLLDILLQVKNLKGKLTEKETYNIDKIEQLKQQLNLTNSDMVLAVFKKVHDELINTDGVIGISIGKVKWEGDTQIGIIVDLLKTVDINKQLFIYILPSGIPKTVPYQIVSKNYAKACYSVNISGKVMNISNVDNFGTLCIPIRRNNKIYLLTCYHVVKHKNHEWEDFYQIGEETIVYETTNIKLGILKNAWFNLYYDVALIEPFPEIEIDKTINGVLVNKSRYISHEDTNILKVKIKGAQTRRIVDGTIVSVHNTQIIDYGNRTFEKRDLIGISNDRNKVVESGDSGSLVFTEDGYAIGMIIATDDSVSYAIPINDLLKEFNLNLIIL